jgi:hypothetical protein
MFLHSTPAEEIQAIVTCGTEARQARLAGSIYLSLIEIPKCKPFIQRVHVPVRLKI